MRARAVWWAAVLLIGYMGVVPCVAQEPVNLIGNGGWETGAMSPWGTYGNVTTSVVQVMAGATVPEPVIEGKYCLYVDVAAGIPNFWEAGLQPTGEVFQKGKKYTISAYMKAKKGTLQVNMKAELPQDPWTAYAERMMTITDTWAEYSVTTAVFTADVTPAGFTFHVGSAVGGFWVDAVRYYEGDYVQPAFLKNYSADIPSPAKDATDVVRDVVLSWKAGPFADTHNVFLGTTFNDVNDASVDSPMGVLASKGQKETSFDPAGLLEYGKVYYWRVDEANAPPDTTIYKGKVWSFTAEPYAYTLTGVTVTASSSSATGATPQKTIDGSGLNANGQHSSADVDGWLTDQTSALPASIQYQFNSSYLIQKMKVWNSNQPMEPSLVLAPRPS